MIPINHLPDLDWTEQSAREIEKSPTLVEDSDFAWQIDDLFIAGWAYPSLVAPPWFWFALTKKFARKNVRRLMELQPRIPPNAHTLVLRDWGLGERFAKFFGFLPTDEMIRYKDIE